MHLSVFMGDETCHHAGQKNGKFERFKTILYINLSLWMESIYVLTYDVYACRAIIVVYIVVLLFWKKRPEVLLL